MGPYFDTYVLVSDRRLATVLAFLDRFLPDRQAPQGEVEGWLGNPAEAVAFSSALVLMQKAEVAETLCGQVYFSNRQTGMPEYAIISYTEDGATVFGLSTNVHVPDPFEAPARFRAEMQPFLGVSNGYSFIEDPPPRSRQEFEANEREFTKTLGA